MVAAPHIAGLKVPERAYKPFREGEKRGSIQNGMPDLYLVPFLYSRQDLASK